SRLKITTAVLALLAALAGGVVALTQQGQDGKPIDRPAAQKKEAEEPTPAVVVDWPQWRGPNRDGVVQGVPVPQRWPRTLKEEWKAPVGEGYPSPVVAGGNVYVFTRQKDDEVVMCFDLASGKDVWRAEPYPAPFRAGPGAPGDIKTRSTPAVAGGRLFTLGVSGILSCFDARTGKLHWRKKTECPIYGASAS